VKKREIKCPAITKLTPQDTLTSVRYPWAQDYATITISLVEEKKNQGRGRLLNLLNQKIDDAETSARDLLATQLLATAPASGSKDPISLTEIVQTTPTTSPSRVASIGNISGTTYSWWRNRATNGGAFSVSDMSTMYNTVSDGSDFPQLLLTGQTVYEYYEASQVGQIRYADTKMADAGFQSLMYKQTPIAWDPLIGITDSLYFLNWQDYIDPATLTQFETREDITVAYQTYVSNDELEKLLVLASQARRRGREAKTYDLCVPSDNFVRKFIQHDMLQQLDQAALTNIGNLRPEFRNEGFDPGNRFTIPWATGSTGIGYDTTVFTQPPDWKSSLSLRRIARFRMWIEVMDNSPSSAPDCALAAII
jgi:hypothetical protein